MPMVSLFLLGTEVFLNVRKEYEIQFEILRGRERNQSRLKQYFKNIIYDSLLRASVASYISTDEFIYCPNNLFLSMTIYIPTQNSLPVT